jgi:hypothetical protein
MSLDWEAIEAYAETLRGCADDPRRDHAHPEAISSGVSSSSKRITASA